MSKIPVWKCDYCGQPPCIMLRTDGENDENNGPERCPYSGNLGVFVPVELDMNEVIECLQKGKYYALQAICKARGTGICPNNIDGLCEGCTFAWMHEHPNKSIYEKVI